MTGGRATVNAAAGRGTWVPCHQQPHGDQGSDVHYGIYHENWRDKISSLAALFCKLNLMQSELCLNV